MPCLTYDCDSYDFSFSQALCGALSALDAQTNGKGIDVIDYKECGVVKSELSRWWKAHQRQDAERRARENEERIVREKREKVLASLSAEERAALGFK